MGKTYRKQRTRDDDYDDQYSDTHGMKQHDKDRRKKKRFTRAIRQQFDDQAESLYEDGNEYGD